MTEFGEEHIDRDRIAALTVGLPRMRWNMGVNHAADRWTLMTRLHYYGSYWDREDARSALGGAMSYLYPQYSGKPLVDLEVGFPFSDFTLSVGAQNIFNTYPDENPGAVDGVGNRYGQFGPFGFNGGYYYTRVSFGVGRLVSSTSVPCGSDDHRTPRRRSRCPDHVGMPPARQVPSGGREVQGMRRLNCRAASVWLILGAFATPVPSVAQEPGTISGTVRDATGLVLPGVTVEARDAASDGQITFTDGTGRFRFSGLAPGAYEVTFTLPGFNAPAQVVEVGSGLTATVDVEMEIGLEERVVVVGTRAQPRSVTESPVPVDVIRTEEFMAQGTTDLANQLRTVVPSFNVSIQPISDAATIVRPANLRNLAPDHTLILVNGKRRHRAAVITWLGNGIADGSQGPDISVIPSIAIRQAEVLRDGAAAQYGSDAIAGVMNFQLKDAREGGSVEFRTGAYRDANPGDRSSCGAGIIGDIKHSCNGIGGRGQAYSVAGNAGLPLGPERVPERQPGVRQREPDQPQHPAQRRTGHHRRRQRQRPQPGADLGLAADRGRPEAVRQLRQPVRERPAVLRPHQLREPHGDRGLLLPESAYPRRGLSAAPGVDGTPTLLVGDRVWADTAPASRDAPAGRAPGAGGCPIIPIVNNVPDATALAAVEADPNCFTLYSRFPGGFTPQFGGDMRDYSLVTGLRGFTSGGVNWDASVNVGSTEVDQFIFDTVNASLGYDTPTSFNPGVYAQDDVNLNFDVSMPVTDVVNFAAGTEWRREQFTIGAGDRASWEIGPYAAQGFSSGSNGFNGYRADTTAGRWSRGNVAVYGDLEFTDPAGMWNFGTAVRLEDFEDFGTTTNGKVSTRVRVERRVLAARGGQHRVPGRPPPGSRTPST